MTRCRLQVCVRGVVQGVGFRPFAYTNAVALGLSGSVCNDTSGAVIEVEGDRGDIDEFLSRLDEAAPPLAVIDAVATQPIPLLGGTGFTIADSSRSGGARTLVSPDVAMCTACVGASACPSFRTTLCCPLPTRADRIAGISADAVTRAPSSRPSVRNETAFRSMNQRPSHPPSTTSTCPLT